MNRRACTLVLAIAAVACTDDGPADRQEVVDAQDHAVRRFTPTDARSTHSRGDHYGITGSGWVEVGGAELRRG